MNVLWCQMANPHSLAVTRSITQVPEPEARKNVEVQRGSFIPEVQHEAIPVNHPIVRGEQD